MNQARLSVNNIVKDVQLRPFNTFGISGTAAALAYFYSKEDLDVIFKAISGNWLVIGQGSNLLFTSNYFGTLLKCTNNTISLSFEDESFKYVKAGAGVIWDDLCRFCVDNSLYGCENLSYIPGTVGASGVQNIGAYGSEAKDVIYSIEYYNTQNMSVETITNGDCNFGYRDSIFKHVLKDKAIILSITYKLSTIESYNLEYGNLKENVAKLGNTLSLATVREAVINTRKERLPDPKIIGNGGSFFKNPVVTSIKFSELQQLYPAIPHYIVDDGYKIPSAWMIDKCGWKSYREGDCGVYEKQPLVLVNYGNATGSEILALSNKIIESVKSKFGITIEPEIIIV